MRRLLPLLAGLTLSLAACQPKTAAPEAPVAAPQAAPPTVLQVYSARHYDSDVAMYAAFEATSGIKIDVLEAKAPQLLERLKAEGGASPADLIIISDAGMLHQFQAAGLTQPMRMSSLAAIPERLREPAGHWVGLAKRARVIAYDPARVKPADVDTYADLADPRLKGMICVRPSKDIYNLSLMGELIGRMGAEAATNWARGVKANFARDPEGGDTDQLKAIAAGQCAVAIVNHYYWVRLAAGTPEDQAIAARSKLSFPDADGTGAHVNISGVAITASADAKESAQAFIEWLATPEGQVFLTSETKEMPVIAGAPLPAGLELIPAFKESDYPLVQLGETQAQAQTLFDLAGWN